MNILKKAIKIQILGLISFGVFTVLSTLIIMTTPIKEAWSYAALMISLCISCFFVGVLEGNTSGRRGLISGIIAAFVLITLILCILNLSINGDYKLESKDIILTIPLFLGAIGGVMGTNVDK